jgi:hypothetical protein
MHTPLFFAAHSPSPITSIIHSENIATPPTHDSYSHGASKFRSVHVFFFLISILLIFGGPSVLSPLGGCIILF